MNPERVSGYEAGTGICWQFRNPGDGACRCPACSGRFGTRGVASFGRCRSGQRWFWCAAMYFDDRDRKATGYAATAEDAFDAAMTAVRSFHNGQPILAIARHGLAGLALKQANEAKRRARPAPDTTDSRVIEYLYSGYHNDDYDELVLHRFRISKRTARRIFYVRKGEWIDERSEPVDCINIGDLDHEAIGFIDRAKLESEGHLYSSHTWNSDWHLFASLEGLIAYLTERDPKSLAKADLAALKQAMARAHPDRGGSSAAFIRARAAYVQARRVQR